MIFRDPFVWWLYGPGVCAKLDWTGRVRWVIR